MVWTKRGSMVAYTGNIMFTREGILEHGIGKLVKRSLTGEGVNLTKAEGKGKLYLDPNATVAWSGNLEPGIKNDISLKTLVGRSSGESIQMSFKGEGFVVIQPYEEVYFQAQA